MNGGELKVFVGLRATRDESNPQTFAMCVTVLMASRARCGHVRLGAADLYIATKVNSLGSVVIFLDGH